MKLYIDNGLSRYAWLFVISTFFICNGASAGVDDVWAASPATNDSKWAQANAAPVNPSHSGSGGAKYQISTYSGSWGSSADFGWHHWCSLTAHTANGDRGTGWNVHTTAFDPITTKSYWRVTYYNISSWGATCYDEL